MKRRRAFDENAMLVEFLDVRAKFGHFKVIRRTNLVDPIVNERIACRLCRDRYEIWQVINVDTRIRAWCDFLRRRHQIRLVYGDVSQYCASIFCHVGFSARITQTHVLKCCELKLKKVYRAPRNGELRMRRRGKRDEEH